MRKPCIKKAKRENEVVSDNYFFDGNGRKIGNMAKAVG